jgi:hypothetical protein
MSISFAKLVGEIDGYMASRGEIWSEGQMIWSKSQLTPPTKAKCRVQPARRYRPGWVGRSLRDDAAHSQRGSVVLVPAGRAPRPASGF